MDICEYCFNSDVISEHIKKQGKKLNCSRSCVSCKKGSIYRYKDCDLRCELQTIIKRFYEHECDHGLVASAYMMAKPENEDISLYLPELMTLKDVCNKLFEIDCDGNFYKLLRDSEIDGMSEFNQNPEEELWLDMGCKWDGVHDIGLEWSEFCNNVKYKARFFDHSGYSRTDELSKLNRTFETLSTEINMILFRARKIDSESTRNLIKRNPTKELGKAPSNFAGFNRFSPNGISYVYLSEKKETAMLEIRLEHGKQCAIGEFQISTLNLVDLRSENLEQIQKDPFSEKFTPELICSFKYIRDFITDISKPIKEDDKYLDYIPTQIVSEYIWSLGYNGFIFDSSLCNGDNYVLFDEQYKFINYLFHNFK